jgi:hypothetical protein
MNLLSSVQRVTDPQRITDHLDYALWRLNSYFQCRGLGKYAKAISAIYILQEINLS